MRTKLIFIILLCLIASKNEELTKNIDNNKILNKKRTLQKFIVPSDIQKHSDWKTLKMLHDIEIRELRENIKYPPVLLKLSKDKMIKIILSTIY